MCCHPWATVSDRGVLTDLSFLSSQSEEFFTLLVRLAGGISAAAAMSRCAMRGPSPGVESTFRVCASMGPAIEARLTGAACQAESHLDAERDPSGLLGSRS